MKQTLSIIKYCYYFFFILFCISCTDNESKKDITPNQPINKLEFESDNPYVTIDKSPLDISYFPPNFPSERMNGADKNMLLARVVYSRPQKNNREIFSNNPTGKNFIQLYGKEWRMGANEATEIEFFKPVTIQGNKVAAGRYIIYCIPYPDKWIVKLNTNLYSWGLHMNPKKDVMQVTLPVAKSGNDIEYYTMVFQETTTGANLLMAWGNIEVTLPIVFE